LKKDLKACDSRHDNLSFNLEAAPIMRWCLYIPSILILLTLGVELCSSHGVAVVKDPSHMAWVLDDNNEDLKSCGPQESSFADGAPLFLAGQQVNIWLMTTGLILPLKEAEIQQIRVGVRRHRWLCLERC
jgi:hypothetical protein